MELSVVLQYLFPSWSEMLTSLASAIVVALLAYLVSQSPSGKPGDEQNNLESLNDEASLITDEAEHQKQQALLAAALKAEGIPISVPVRQVGAGELAVPPRPLVIGLDAQDVLRRGMGARRTRPRRAETTAEGRVDGKAGNTDMDASAGVKVGKLTLSEANPSFKAGAGNAAAASASRSPATGRERADRSVQTIQAAAAGGGGGGGGGRGKSPASPAAVVTVSRAASGVHPVGDTLLKETLSEPGRLSDSAIPLQASSRELVTSELRSPGNQGERRSPEKRREGWGGEGKQASKAQKQQEKQQRQLQRQEQRQELREQKVQQQKHARGQGVGVSMGDGKRQLRATKTINESLMRRLCLPGATATSSAAAGGGATAAYPGGMENERSGNGMPTAAATGAAATGAAAAATVTAATSATAPGAALAFGGLGSRQLSENDLTARGLSSPAAAPTGTSTTTSSVMVKDPSLLIPRSISSPLYTSSTLGSSSFQLQAGLGLKLASPTISKAGTSGLIGGGGVSPGSQSPARGASPARAAPSSSTLGQQPSSSAATDVVYEIKVELLAAKNLPASGISGNSDPYAIVSCDGQRRFSSVIPASRNPMWGEAFNFVVPSLPTTVSIEIYDWDIILKGTELGAASLLVEGEAPAFTAWYYLSKGFGQICLQLEATQTLRSKAEGITSNLPIRHRRSRSRDDASLSLQSAPSSLPSHHDRSDNLSAAFASATDSSCALQRDSAAGGATEVRQKPGPLQKIFDLPPDEVVLHSFSCALERSFLYHGRMYLSAWHLCFHSNVFGKHISFCIPYQDVEEVKRSVHGIINPAICVILRAGAGGHGVPPLASPDGRATYKFASFWNRGHTYRVLLDSVSEFWRQQEAAAAEEEQALLRCSSSLKDSYMHVEESLADAASRLIDRVEEKEEEEEEEGAKPFIHHELLEPVTTCDLPCTAQQFFDTVLADGSDFFPYYRGTRRDTELEILPWHDSPEFGGQVREMRYRSKCNSPMCPPSTAITEWQRYCFSTTPRGQQQLVFETVSQAHDVPFGSYFELHCQWVVTTVSASPSSPTSTVAVRMGVNFKKWLIMQGKIKHGAMEEYKSATAVMVPMISDFVTRQEEVDQQKEQEGDRDGVNSFESKQHNRVQTVCTSA